MCDGLVRSDRGLPDRALLHVVDGFAQRETTHPHRRRRSHDAFWIQTGEELAQCRVRGADECVSRQAHIVEVEPELLFRVHQFHVDHLVFEPRCVRGHDEQRGPQLAGLRILAPTHDENGIGLIDTGDVHLAPVEDPVRSVARCRGGDLMRIRSGVGFGDTEGHRDRSVGKPRQPPVALLVGAEARNDVAADGRRDNEHQQAGARRRDLLHHDRQLVHSCAATAVLLGKIHPDEAQFARLRPQFVGLATLTGAFAEVVLPVLGGQRGHRCTQIGPFSRFDEAHADVS